MRDFPASRAFAEFIGWMERELRRGSAPWRKAANDARNRPCPLGLSHSTGPCPHCIGAIQAAEQKRERIRRRNLANAQRIG